MTERAVKALKKVLTTERRCLLDGDYGALADMSVRKERALKRFDPENPPVEMPMLLKELQRNHTLTKLALDQMSEIIAAEEHAREREGHLDLYGPDGLKSLDCRDIANPGQTA